MNTFEAGVVARLKAAGLLDVAERAAKRAAKRAELRLADCIVPGEATGGHRALWRELARRTTPDRVSEIVGFPVAAVRREMVPEARPTPAPASAPRAKVAARPQAPARLPEIPDLEVPDGPAPKRTSWSAMGTVQKCVVLAEREGVLHHLHATAERHAVSVFALLGPSRVGRVVRARREAAWRLHELAGLGSPRIGEILGGRDHSTILHHLRVFEPDADLRALGPGKAAA
jgi:hypothetical protein